MLLQASRPTPTKYLEKHVIQTRGIKCKIIGMILEYGMISIVHTFTESNLSIITTRPPTLKGANKELMIPYV